MRNSAEVRKYLEPSLTVDSSNPAIGNCADNLLDANTDTVENAQRLYYWVRDSIRYNPYGIDLDPAMLSASHTLKSGEGWCVPKAILLAALCRYAGIPARLGFSDVRNHLSTERLRSTMGTDIFYFHGYTSLYLGGRWVKATPAFNIELCDKFGLKPLEFDGRIDSLYHEYDNAGNRHMQYLNDRGEFLDIPLKDMTAVFREKYASALSGHVGKLSARLDSAQWDADVAHETDER
ncbi:MAG: transglutaminase family protein [Halieaceae bacterium]|uniref:transglutaminase-like domain-containing protein n=1 Tax=Haliea alexandrii TaxID=2448162 RepID=UPI000F0B774F|nr:transglutaminase family protein [Haliea alexandrii]MCR9183902.1 transglutaminase family protein [Halieaceae bacterium]